MTEILVSLQSLLPQHGLSRLVGWLADLERPVWLKRLLIVAFARAYDIDFGYTESRRSAEWRSFNEFFTRGLVEGTRPVADTRYVQPAEGLLSQCGVIDEGWLVQAKGRWYSAHDLLAGSAEEAQAFDGASFMTTYLSPRDYHRVHMPISGRLTRTRYVPGDLFAVNQHTARGVDRLYARNERLVCFFDTADGEMALVLVGAASRRSGRAAKPRPPRVWWTRTGEVPISSWRRARRWADSISGLPWWHCYPERISSGAQLQERW